MFTAPARVDNGRERRGEGRASEEDTQANNSTVRVVKKDIGETGISFALRLGKGRFQRVDFSRFEVEQTCLSKE